MTQGNRLIHWIGLVTVASVALFCGCSVAPPRSGVIITDRKDNQSGATEFTLKRPIEKALDAMKAFRMCAMRMGFTEDEVDASLAVGQIELTEGSFHLAWKQKSGVIIFACQQGGCVVSIAALTLPL